MNTIQKIIWMIVVVIFAGFCGIVGKSLVASLFNKSQQDTTISKELEESLIENSKILNKQLPVMVDADTRLDYTMYASSKLLYRYTLMKLLADEIDKADLKAIMQPVVIKNVCGNEKTLRIVRMGAEYNYIYFDKAGEFITEVTVGKKQCGL